MGNLWAKLGNFALRIFAKAPTPPLVEIPDSEPVAIVLLVPGTFLTTYDYAVLRQRLLAARCCVVTCSPRWRNLDVADFMGSASRLVEKAMEEGLAVMELSPVIPAILLEKNGFGPVWRYKRLVVALHSLSGVVGSNSIPLRKAAGTVLLASGFSHAVGISAAMREFPSPLLSVFGEYDGQHHLGKVAVDLGNSGLVFDEKVFSQRAFAMIEHCNHASFSNGLRNAKRGDLSLEGLDDVDAATSMAKVARLITIFARSHGLEIETSTPRKRREASDQLRAETQRSIVLLRPFLVALGRCPERLPRLSLLSVDQEDALVWKYAVGGEMVPGNAPKKGFVPHHPGELAAAEHFACQCQQYVLGRPTSPRLVITATVHTVFDTFLRSKVHQYVDDGGVIFLSIQCFMLAGKGEAYSHVSPMYAMKLKSADGLEILQERGGKDLRALDEAGTPSPSDLFNDLAWRRAEALCPPELYRRFQARGQPIEVKERYHCLPPIWAKSRCKLEGNVLTLHSFDASRKCGTPGETRGEEGVEREAMSLRGIIYCQVPSPAWCLEHIMVHGLKSRA